MSYPDLESFDLRRSMKKSKRPRQKTVNKDFTYDVDNLSDGESNKGRLSKRRSMGRKAPTSVNLPSVNEEDYKEENVNVSMTPNPYLGEEGLPQVPIIDAQDDEDSGMEDLCYYPHRKHTKREEFLNVWKHSFSKQWDVICKWNFKNKQKMYGSVQFESLVKSGLSFGEERLEYFHSVIDDLLSFK